jgi:hypothetical protein
MLYKFKVVRWSSDDLVDPQYVEDHLNELSKQGYRLVADRPIYTTVGPLREKEIAHEFIFEIPDRVAEIQNEFPITDLKINTE